MTPNNKKVERLLTLARLSLSELEIQNISLDFKKIMKFIDKLNEIDTRDLTPLTHIHETYNIFREDKVDSVVDVKKDMLKNAQNHDSDYFKVSKMIEDNK